MNEYLALYFIRENNLVYHPSLDMTALSLSSGRLFSLVSIVTLPQLINPSTPRRTQASPFTEISILF